tara:strand:+ start:2120 stop:2482 length:363 start_codon:yes stop_codon:yes gene_type:complete
LCYPCLHKANRLAATQSPELFLKYRLGRAKGRAQEKNLEFDLDHECLIDLYQQQKGYCAISELPMTSTYENPDLCISIDRMDNEVGYIKTNIRLVCYRVNIMRNELSEGMFKWWIKQIAK